MNERIEKKQSPEEKLIELITPLIAPLGYEVVQIEVQSHRQKVLRLFIDFTESKPGRAVGIEDCVHVTKALDEPLESLPEIDKIFQGAYELEVSSPGVYRPLRQEKDYERFSGQEARIHVFRPLTAEEIGNVDYLAKNPKQKNFLGTIRGIRDNKVLLSLGQQAQPGKKGKAAPRKGKGAAGQATTNSVDEVAIPLPLISKANLEPKFDDLAERE